MNFFLNGFIMV